MDPSHKIVYAIICLALFSPAFSSAIPFAPISDCDDLYDMRLDADVAYGLTDDIYCNVSPYNESPGFTPICDDPADNGTCSGAFTGSLDGTGHTIYGLSINQEEYVGLFYSLSGATVTNLTISGANVTGEAYVGILAGLTNDSEVSHVAVSGDVVGFAGVGGLVGVDISEDDVLFDILSEDSISSVEAALSDEGESDMGLLAYLESYDLESYDLESDDLESDGAKSPGRRNGQKSLNRGLFNELGLVGESRVVDVRLDHVDPDQSIFNNVSSSATISADGGFLVVGGLIGIADASIIYNSYTTGNVNGALLVGGLIGLAENVTINNSYATGNVTGGIYVGGLIGANAYCIINNSYATGHVDCGAACGGLFGETVFNSTIANSYATGHVEGGNAVGGLVGISGGYYYGGDSAIDNSYATGNVDGEDGVGGLVGYNGLGYYYYFNGGSATIDNSYATGNITGEYNLGGLVGITYGGVINNSHYNINTTLINGESLVTFGGVYDDVYTDWMDNNLSLNISEYFSQDGDDYYLIADWVDFAEFLGFSDTNNKFRLSGDINLSSAPGLFIPSISVDEFDGDGKTISGLGVDIPFNQMIGAFGYAYETSITNLSVEGTVSGADDVGGLVGYAYESAINNSNSSVVVTGEDYVAGLMGYAVDSSVNNSFATGDISGEDYIGGLIGDSYDITVDNSYATGDITGEENVGGLIGFAYDASVDNSYATGDVTADYEDIGGLIGDSYYLDVDNSYATGDVRGTESVGGLVGEGEDMTVNNSYATGDVRGHDDDVGGLVGYSYDDSTIDNSYATGVITRGNNRGGLVGHQDDDCSINNSFWAHYGYEGVSSCVGDDDGTTDCQVADSEDYFYNVSKAPEDVWDFATIWDDFCNNSGYPALQWQNLTNVSECYVRPVRNYCGDGVCNRDTGETCTTCHADCICDNHARESSCDDPWECTDWAVCRDGVQTRDCFCSCDRWADCTGDNDEEQSCTVQQACSDSWSCSSWGSCVSGLQSRVCTCSCDNESDCTGDSSESQSCTVTQPPQTCSASWSCSSWSECSNSAQTRSCTCSCPDGGCIGDSSESRSCTMPGGSGAGSTGTAGGAEGSQTGSSQSGLPQGTTTGLGKKAGTGSEMNLVIVAAIIVVVLLAGFYLLKMQKPAKKGKKK